MKPLPLIDNNFFIDNSTLELLTTCPRSMEYAKLYKRVINKPAPALNFGSGLHLALETRYTKYRNDKPSDACFADQVEAMAQHFAANPQPDEDPRSLNWAVEVIKRYNQQYNTEPFNILVDAAGVPLVELPFTLPLYKRGDIHINYIGRIDLPVMWDGSVWIIDHKSASRLGDSYFDEKQMSAQQIGYCWAFEQLTGMSVAGFCINALRTSTIPAKPKDGPDAWWRETLQRQRYHVTEEQKSEWKTNTIALCEEFFYHYEKGMFPQKTAWCSGKYGKCQYFGVCSYPMDKREGILASEEYTDNNWSPLKQTHE